MSGVRPRTERALALVLLVACSSAAVAGEQVVRRTMTLGDDAGARFSSIAGFSVDAQGSFYVTDQLAYAVKKFDARGRFLGMTGGRGTAPGKFTSPGLTVIRGDRVIVLQMREPRIEVFDTRLGFRGEFAAPGGMPVDMAENQIG
jgi:hypothetical protein